MFDTPQKRALLRAALAAVLAGLAAAAAIFIDNDFVQIAAAVGGAFGAYIGVGAAVPQIEPNLGNKLEDS